MGLVIAAMIFSLSAVPAYLQFQMIYTTETALKKASEIDLKLGFTHHFEAGHTMDTANLQIFL